MLLYFLKKSLVILVIILFLGSSIVTRVNGINYQKEKDTNSLYQTINTCLLQSNVKIVYDLNHVTSNIKSTGFLSDDFVEVVDQEQNKTSGKGYVLTSDIWLAQGFLPSLNILSKFQLMMFKDGSPSSNIEVTVSVRDSLSGNDIVSSTIYGREIPEDSAWIDFDFPDVSITPNKIHYIVCRASGGERENSYAWSVDFNNPYKFGQGWQSYKSKSSWILLDEPDYPLPDLCFKTYGKDKPPSKPIITGPAYGKPGETYTYTFYSIDPEDHDMFYWVDWDDESDVVWLGPFPSGENFKLSHSWSVEGTYSLKIKSKDIYDAESEWTDPLRISIPKSRLMNIGYLINTILERYNFFIGRCSEI